MAMITGFMHYQNLWKNKTGRPSGPGAELACIPLIATRTSSGENRRVSSPFYLSETVASAGHMSWERKTLERGPAEKSSL